MSESLKIPMAVGEDLTSEVFVSETVPQLGPDSHLYSLRKDGALGTEQLRMLQVRLMELQSQRPFKRLLITSANRGEGKTHTATNLALTLASRGHSKVLLIDADVRRPSVHVTCGIPNAYGLKDWLHNGGNPWKAIRRVKPAGLFVMTGGTAAIESLSASNIPQVQTLVDQLAPAFDLILLDSAPLLGVVDTKMVSTVADAVLLVVRAGITPRALVLQAQELLEGQNIIGVALNGIDPKQPCYASYYSYSSTPPPSPRTTPQKK